MENGKSVLVMGGTGAMGVYLVPELIRVGYKVDVTTRRHIESDTEGLKYLTGDAMDDSFISRVLCNHYDAVVDFMIYPSKMLESRIPMLLDATAQYIFLSSYRVYGNLQIPITETAPQLIDAIDDEEFLASDDYSLRKSHGEQVLRQSGKKNWTIIRPAITYSKYRFQLITLEARNFVCRAMENKKVLVPKEALNVQATMTWAGDVAKMITGLVGNEKALGECFTVSTSEHHTWGEIADYYRRIIGLEIDAVDKKTFLNVVNAESTNFSSVWQLDYDRLYERIVDNSKILSVTGLKQEDFTTLYDGLNKELSALREEDMELLSGSAAQSVLMDAYYEKHAWKGKIQ